MNEWDQRIRDHRVWTEMKTLGPAIDNALAVEDLSPEALLGLERLRAALAYCGKRIAAADPQLTPPQSLDGIASPLSAVQNELLAFVTDKDAAHISTANLTMDNALAAVSQVPGAYSPEELGTLIAAFSGYRNIVSEALRQAQEKLDDFKKESTASQTSLTSQFSQSSIDLTARIELLHGNLGTIAASLEAEKQKIAAILSEQQGQFSTAQEARTTQFTEGLRLATEGYTKLVTDYQSQFSTAQEARSTENIAAELARQKQFNETVANFSKKLTDQDAEFTKQRTAVVATSEIELARLISEYRDNASEILKEVEGKRKDVEDLVGVIGNLGVTSGYLKVANRAKWSMWIWQGATLTALITLSYLAYRTLAVLEDSSGKFNWGAFAARALLLVSLGVIAAYSGSQADKLFGDERRNRKLALELEAIGPYLAPLPIDEQHKFRLQMGALSFGRDYDPHEHGKSPASVVDLIKSKEGKEWVKLIIEAAGAKAKDK